MKIINSFVILSLFLISSCSFDNKNTEPNTTLFHLTDSTKIIVSLLQTNKLGTILEDHDPGQLDTLIFNISPAVMAFESEVLSCTLPVIAYFYSPIDTNYVEMIKILEQFALQHQEYIKFVTINAEHLFSVAQQAAVDKTPTITLIHNRVEIKRLENFFDKKSIAKLINIISET